MQKRKRTNTHSFAYWWNELLFAREVEMQSNLSLDELSGRLLAMQHGRQGFLWGLLRTSETQMQDGGKEMTFRIQSRRKRWGDLFSIATATAEGSAQVDSTTGNLRIQYVVTFGRLLHLMLLFYLFTMVLILAPMMLMESRQMFLFVALAWSLFLAFYWWTLYLDRNELAADIQQQASIEPLDA